MLAQIRDECIDRAAEEMFFGVEPAPLGRDDPRSKTLEAFRERTIGRINEEALDDTRAYDAEIDAPLKKPDVDAIFRGMDGDIVMAMLKPGKQRAALYPRNGPEPMRYVDIQLVTDNDPIDRAEILRRGVVLDDIDGDTMTHVMDKLGWPRPGFPMGKRPTHALVTIEEAARLLYAEPEPANIAAPESDGDVLARLGTDHVAWTDRFMGMACYNNPLGRALRQFPHGDRDELWSIMLGWFANAIEAGRSAGYEAARPLDPGTIYVSHELTREEERAAAGLSSNFTSPPVPAGSAWQPTDDAMRINPVEDAIMPELRESLYDETAAIAEAAGEGMGVACEKPE